MTLFEGIRTALLLALAVTTACLIAGLALASKNANSTSFAGGSTPMAMPNMVTGFSLAGSVLGLVVCSLGFVMIACVSKPVDWYSTARHSWPCSHRLWHIGLIASIFAVWLLGGGVASMGLMMYNYGHPTIWGAQIALDILSSFFLGLSATFAVAWMLHSKLALGAQD